MKIVELLSFSGRMSMTGLVLLLQNTPSSVPVRSQGQFT